MSVPDDLDYRNLSNNTKDSDKQSLTLKLGGHYIDFNGNHVVISQQFYWSSKIGEPLFIGNNGKVYLKNGKLYAKCTSMGDSLNLFDEIEIAGYKK